MLIGTDELNDVVPNDVVDGIGCKLDKRFSEADGTHTATFLANGSANSGEPKIKYALGYFVRGEALDPCSKGMSAALNANDVLDVGISSTRASWQSPCLVLCNTFEDILRENDWGRARRVNCKCRRFFRSCFFFRFIPFN